MSDDVKITVTGDKFIADALRSVSKQVAGKIVMAGARTGAGVIAKHARRNVPVDTGNLRKAIRTKAKRFSNLMGAHGYVYINKGSPPDGWYARLVEFGTEPHEIRLRKKNALAYGGVVYEAVQHPGARAHPFMRPALQSAANEVLRKVGIKMGRDIETAASKP